MKRFTRRSFLAVSAATAASSFAVAAPAPAREMDVVIVGAGAAGIAAARRIVAAGRSVVLLEASARIGGRCFTETQSFGVPFDGGAHWIHAADVNPVAKLAAKTGLDLYRVPAGQRLRIGRRDAREGELEDFLATMVRATRALDEAAHGKADLSAAAALPKDLGDWRPVVDFVLGPFATGKDLRDISAMDVSRAASRDAAAFCRQGYGALLAKLAEGLPVQLSTPVTRLDWGTRIEAETPKGKLTARYAIVTASTDMLVAGKIKFAPELPKRQLDAAAKLKLGSYDHIALELMGNPLGLRRDERVFEKSAGPRTAALLANVSGTPLALVEVAGAFGRDLAAQGERAMVDFAVDWLAGFYGADIRKAVGRSHATRWNEAPWTLGAMSAAAPGNQGARKVLIEPLRDRLYLAGEATHETLWGTVGGAWESGERAAEAVLRKMGALKAPNEPASRRPRRR